MANSGRSHCRHCKAEIFQDNGVWWSKSPSGLTSYAACQNGRIETTRHETEPISDEVQHIASTPHVRTCAPAVSGTEESAGPWEITTLWYEIMRGELMNVIPELSGDVQKLALAELRCAEKMLAAFSTSVALSLTPRCPKCGKKVSFTYGDSLKEGRIRVVCENAMHWWDVYSIEEVVAQFFGAREAGQ